MRTGENIYKRKDGRWEARYCRGRNESGGIVYGFCYGKTYSEAKRKSEEAKKNRNTLSAGADDAEKGRFCVFCDAWLQENRQRLKESTYVKYGTTLEKYIKPYLGDKPIAQLNDKSVAEFRTTLFEDHGLAPKTVKDILLILHSVIKFSSKRIPGKAEGVEIIYPKEKHREMRVLTNSEQNVLTEYLLSDPDYCKFGVLLALWTGIRIGELCALRWNHISCSDQFVRIDSTMQRLKDIRPDASAKTRIVIDTPKSASSVRVIPINSQAVALCKQMMPPNSAAYVLTGNPHYMEPRVLQYHFGRYVAACGLEDVHFHTLRHTFATRCVEVGFEIKSLSEILGHANTAITLNRYVHCSLKLKRENMKKLENVGM